jgi:thiamine-monophosphate kinase
MLTDAEPGFTPVEELGEFPLIDLLNEKVPKLSDSVQKGIGDDAAVIDTGGPLYRLVSTDLLLDGIHFDLTYMPFPHLGYKAAVVNFSDIYAMNGNPRQLVVGLGLNNRFSVEQIEALYEGLLTACQEHGVDLVGGDTCSSRSGLVLSITVLGEVEKDKVVYRSGGKVNDLVCVSGDVGAAIAGFRLLEAEKMRFLEDPQGIQPDLSEFEYVIGRQLKPHARRDIVTELRKRNVVPTSMIDVSDGPASEIHHICKQSKCGARIYQDKLPIDYQTIKAAEELNELYTHFALYGGEDYELMFTISQADYPKTKNWPEITVIGHLTDASNGVEMVLTDGSITRLQPMGFSHFGREQSLQNNLETES